MSSPTSKFMDETQEFWKTRMSRSELARDLAREWVPRSEFDKLAAEVKQLRARVDQLDGGSQYYTHH